MRSDLSTRIGDLRVRKTTTAKTSLMAAPDGTTLRTALLVTGASEGIGVELARAFADTADEIVLIARRADKLSETSKMLSKRLDQPVHPLAVDLTDDDALARIDAFLDEKKLAVRVLINNAGVAYAGVALDQHPQTLATMLDLNMRVPALLTHRFLPGMMREGAGGVVNISSLGGFYPGPYQAHYYATKAYLNSLGKALNYEAGSMGVRVLTVAPGPVGTRIHAKMGSDNALYRYVLPSLSAERVANDSRWAYALGRRTLVPGIVNRLMSIISGVVPHVVLMPLLALLLRPPQATRLKSRDKSTLGQTRVEETGVGVGSE
ncbi:MAG: SDR family NAD(P)-dependent oxidoreductase [Pseudomonadota bacterium]